MLIYGDQIFTTHFLDNLVGVRSWIGDLGSVVQFPVTSIIFRALTQEYNNKIFGWH